MKSKFKRFIGKGTLIGDEKPAWAWQVTCRTCSRIEQVLCHGNNPESTWRRFEQMGWRLGKNTNEDECNDCIAKRREVHRKERDDRRHVADLNVKTAADKARHDLIEAMSPTTLVAAMQNGHAVLPDDAPDTKARVAAACLVQEVLTHNRWDLYEIRDLLELVLRYWALEDKIEQRRDIRVQVKIATFSKNRLEAAAARTEIHRLLSQVDEAREAAWRARQDELTAATPPPKFKSPAQNFRNKIGPLADKKLNELMAKPVKPEPEQWFMDAAPKPPPPVVPKPPPPPPPPSTEQPTTNDEPEPAWLRKARQRYKG